jgi:hypothetical protein
MQISVRELPPALALAADRNIGARARQLQAAGITGDMDSLRALACLEMFGVGSLGSQLGPGPGGPGNGTDAGTGPGEPQPGTPGSHAVPPGFAAKVNLTVALADLTIPLLTLLGPARCPGSGPSTPAWPGPWPPRRPATPPPPRSGASPSPGPTTGPSPTAAADPALPPQAGPG